jgi:methionyl-tRNA formyltransferase
MFLRCGRNRGGGIGSFVLVVGAGGVMRRAVLLGKGELAIRVAQWFAQADDYELAAIVPVIPEPGWTASLRKWATSAGIPCVESGHHRDLRWDEGDQIDLAMSVFYDRIFESDFIDRCGRILNLHNAPLPRYRGMSPINWALKNGERSHGVTLHEVTPGVDSGPIVSQVEYSIYPDTDEVIDVYRRSLEFAWTLFTETMPILDRIQPRPQDESEATYYSAADSARLGDRAGFTRAESIRRRHAEGLDPRVAKRASRDASRR